MNKEKDTLFILFLLVLSFSSFSQKGVFSFPNFMSQTFSDVQNNPNWNILSKASGDLNLDEHRDLTLVLETRDSVFEKRCSGCKLLKNKPRVLLVLLGDEISYKVFIQNNKFIARGDEGGMASYIQPELSIRNNNLIIYYQFTRSNISYSFEYAKGKMIINRARVNSVQSATGDFEGNIYNFKKKNIIVTTGNISEEEDEVDTLKLSVQPKTLSKFQEMMEWEVAPDKYL